MYRRACDIVCTNIDDNNTRFEPGTLNELGFSDGSDEDVSFFNLRYCEQPSGEDQPQTYNVREVLGFAVALGHGGVPVPKHGCDRATDDVAPAKDDSTKAFHRDSGGLEQADDTSRCAWGEQGFRSA